MIRKLLFCSAAVCAVLFSGCKEKVEAPDSLEGTVWKFVVQENSEVMTTTLYFYKDTFKNVMADRLIGQEGNVDTETFQGKYTYSRPDVVLEDNSGETIDYLQGVVKGDELIFQEEGEDPVVFKKM